MDKREGRKNPVCYSKSLMVIFLILFLSSASPAEEIIDRLPETTDNIHLLLLFNTYVKNPQDEAGKVDLVWGSKFPAKPQGVFNTYYFPFDRDPGVDTIHDLAWFKKNHPDWIVYTCDRTTPAWSFGNTRAVPLDITNHAVLMYMIQTYLWPAIQQGYQGIAFDNMSLFYNQFHRCGIWNNGTWVQQFTGGDNDPAYIAAVLTWAKWMYSVVHWLGAAVLMNPVYDQYHPDLLNQLLPFLDVFSSERGFGVDTSPKLFTFDQWLTNMKRFQALDAQGKGFVSINEMAATFEQVTNEQKQWVLANYLLVKGKHSYVTINGIQEYGKIFTTLEYSAPIGHPVKEMYQSQGVYMRDFSNGKAIVNPSHDTSFSVSLPAGVYYDLNGYDQQAVTLKPLSGLVLLQERWRKGFLMPIINLLLN